MTVALLWRMHMATFAFSGVALGVALFALSLAAARVGLVPRWFGLVGPLGAVIISVPFSAISATAQGWPGIYFGLIGFVVWLVFLGTVGVQMWRERTPTD